MTELLALLGNLAVEVFAVASMALVGLRYSLREILTPLRNVKGVLLALLANFVAVPLLAFVVTRVIQLERAYEIGLILVALAAGAPFVIKLTELACGTVAFSSGVLVLLLVATIVYMPIAVPILVPSTTVGTGSIARPLILTMLVPLVGGLALKALLPASPKRLLPLLARVSNISLVLVVVLSFAANVRTLRGVFGTGAILVALLVTAGAFGLGWLFGGFGRALRDEMAFITAQRNFAAAMVLATQSLHDPGVLVMVVVMSLVSMGVLFPAAYWMGKRVARDAARAGGAGPITSVGA